MVEPRYEAQHVLKYQHGIIRYGTSNHGLRYASNNEVQLQEFTYSDWAESAEDINSSLGCCFSFGFVTISWMSRKQNFVSLSIAESNILHLDQQVEKPYGFKKILARLFDQVQVTTMMIGKSTMRFSTKTWYKRKWCGSNTILQSRRLLTKPLSQDEVCIP